jgi:hypothetical protein
LAIPALPLAELPAVTLLQQREAEKHWPARPGLPISID